VKRAAIALAASALALAAAASGCSSFQNPEIVLDFRLLAIRASLPEQVIDVDITDPQPPVELLEQVEPSEICVLVADPLFERRLRWEMSVCVLNNDERCYTAAPRYEIGRGFWNDPEITPSAQFCDTIHPDGNLLGVALAAFQGDAFRGLGGIYYGVSLRVGGEGEDPADDLYGAKELRLMPRIPADIQANNNPTLDGLEITLPDAEPIALPFGRCSTQAAPVEVAPDSRVRIMPIETEGAREPYVVPTTDGSSRMFTESLTYQWLATAGNYSSGRTGGTRDAVGNPATLFTDWVAPDLEDLEGTTDVDLWVIQRDERLGLTWYESCLRVVVP
jgi:hypothetical protein